VEGEVWPHNYASVAFIPSRRTVARLGGSWRPPYHFLTSHPGWFRRAFNVHRSHTRDRTGRSTRALVASIIGTNVALHTLLGREFPFSRRTADSPTRRTYHNGVFVSW